MQNIIIFYNWLFRCAGWQFEIWLNTKYNIAKKIDFSVWYNYIIKYYYNIYIYIYIYIVGWRLVGWPVLLLNATSACQYSICLPVTGNFLALVKHWLASCRDETSTGPAFSIPVDIFVLCYSTYISCTIL